MKKLLGAFKISEMSDKELDEFAEGIVEVAKEATKEKPKEKEKEEE